MVKGRLDRARQRRSVDEARRSDEEEDEDKAAGEEQLSLETEEKEEEAAEILKEALGMEVKEEGEVEEGGDGNLRALGAL